MNVLDDIFITSSVDQNLYREEIAKFSDRTKCFLTRGADIQLFSYSAAPGLQRKDGKTTFFALLPECERAFEEGRMVPNCGIDMRHIPDDLVVQMEHTSGLAAVIGDEFYLISELAMPMLCRWSGVTGQDTENHSLARDLHIAESLHKRNTPLQVIYREDDNGVKKIFAFMTKSYAFKPQRILLPIIDSIAEKHELDLECCTIGQDMTNVYLDLPMDAKSCRELFEAAGRHVEKGDFVPKLDVRTSDVGRSSICVRALLAHDGHYVIMDEVTAMHTGEMTKLADGVDALFAELLKLPETLLSLMGMPIVDETVDLTTEAGQEQNRRQITKAVKAGFKVCSPDFGGCSRKKRTLQQDVINEFDPSVRYTLYDVAEKFLGLADRVVGMNDNVKDNLRKDCAKVPYQLLHDAEKSSRTEKEEEVYLAPEE